MTTDIDIGGTRVETAVVVAATLEEKAPVIGNAAMARMVAPPGPSGG